METLTKICETLDCDISDVIQLEREENCTVSTGNN
ncbi:MAG: helix-turn-helix domain-containing protein [Lachnospiraceae bacterium]|nr:helix-turn-helix domain-containing protein [Lachnospiraceae bacterium]